MTWREHCRPIITKVLVDNKGKSEREIRKALRDSYPYGQRAMHPYKIWCDEIKIQRNFKKSAISFVPENQTKLL